jgi:hypothetical protein
MLVMKLLIYACPSNSVGRGLRKKLQSTGVEAWAEAAYCNSLVALDKHLRKPLGKSPVGILIPSDDDELAALIGMRYLLHDMRLILILADSHQPNIAHTHAHMLRPRFITYADKNLEEVIAVLWKMMDAVHGVAG